MPSSGTGERTSAVSTTFPRGAVASPFAAVGVGRPCGIAGRSAPLVVARVLARDRPLPVVADDVAALEVVDAALGDGCGALVAVGAVPVGAPAHRRLRLAEDQILGQRLLAVARVQARQHPRRPAAEEPTRRRTAHRRRGAGLGRRSAAADRDADPFQHVEAERREIVRGQRRRRAGIAARRLPGVFGDHDLAPHLLDGRVEQLGEERREVVAHAVRDLEVGRDEAVGVVRDLEARRRVDDVDDQVLLAARVEQAEPHRQAQLVGVEVEAQRRQLHDALRVALHLLDVDPARRRTSTCRGCRAPARRRRPAGCCISRAAARSRGPTSRSPTGSGSRIRRRRTSPRS